VRGGLGKRGVKGGGTGEGCSVMLVAWERCFPGVMKTRQTKPVDEVAAGVGLADATTVERDQGAETPLV
jgi:hypothetical protein